MKQKTVGGCPKPLWIVATVLAASVGVTACGGGGGGGGGGMPMLPMGVVPTPAPAPAPSPAPAPAPAENRDAVPGSEPSPSLSAPQAGSTAAVGNDSEGIYAAGVRGLAFVGADGSIARSFTVGTLWGSLKLTGLDWSFNPDTEFSFLSVSQATGSGTFAPKKTMNGTYAYGTRDPADFGPLTYTIENALAVSQASVVGTWSNNDSSLGVTVRVDDKGVFTGTTSGAEVGQCTLSGTVALAQPGSAKNMYELKLKAVNAAMASKDDCELTLATAGSYVGPAAIGLVPAGVFESNGYFRSLMFLIRSNTGATLLVGLRKQP